ncbi:hypothetical protein [Candidatus Nitrosocosmicus sp. FF01]|uniref:hypothetical protein n=1 Tax=Candidatus Nitrosocosmicus sp. FF01 TaxID=3397670 RepID=UPI0039ED2557
MLTTLKNHKSIVMLSATLFATTVLLFGAYSSNGINAQSLEKITINFNTLTFGPTTSNPLHQVYSLVDYQLKDLSLLNTGINGEMKVFAPNGTLIKTSSYTNGFTISDESGTVQFRTAIPDQSLTDVQVNVTFTDLNRTEPISNTISSGVALTP